MKWIEIKIHISHIAAYKENKFITNKLKIILFTNLFKKGNCNGRTTQLS